jgi:hypothetical protein
MASALRSAGLLDFIHRPQTRNPLILSVIQRRQNPLNANYPPPLVHSRHNIAWTQ